MAVAVRSEKLFPSVLFVALIHGRGRGRHSFMRFARRKLVQQRVNTDRSLESLNFADSTYLLLRVHVQQHNRNVWTFADTTNNVVD
jgi:hypothetical protein